MQTEINHWLDPLIKNYIEYFGRAERPVVWEVGSRDGRDAVEMASRIYAGEEQWFWSRAVIVALEPNPEQAKIIEKEYPEMDVMKVAASNQKGEAPFMVYIGDEGAVGSSSLDLHWKEKDLQGYVITVQIDRLENLVTDEIDIMKIDVEGHAVEVLEGLGDKLNKIKAFHIETEKWKDTDVKVKALMMTKGYTLVDESEQYGGMPDQVWIRQ